MSHLSSGAKLRRAGEPRSPTQMRTSGSTHVVWIRLSRNACSTYLQRVFLFGRNVTHSGGAFQFVPGKPLTLYSALYRLEEHNRKQLAISKTLQPDLAEQPGIFTHLRFAAFQCESDG